VQRGKVHDSPLLLPRSFQDHGPKRLLVGAKVAVQGMGKEPSPTVDQAAGGHKDLFPAPLDGSAGRCGSENAGIVGQTAHARIHRRTLHGVESLLWSRPWGFTEVVLSACPRGGAAGPGGPEDHLQSAVLPQSFRLRDSGLADLAPSAPPCPCVHIGNRVSLAAFNRLAYILPHPPGGATGEK